MLTVLGYSALAVLMVGGLFLLASKLLPAGEQLAPSVRDEPIWSLPADRPIGAYDVAVVRLPVAIRGYRFAETDQLLDRLAEELRLRDEEIARLNGFDVRAAPVMPEPPAVSEPPVVSGRDAVTVADDAADVD